jgi:hypothetical protein
MHVRRHRRRVIVNYMGAQSMRGHAQSMYIDAQKLRAGRN